ncbi:ribonuclease P 40kDa subunit-domain-containing protein, partial [Phakopsora pachyrhizi]
QSHHKKPTKPSVPDEHLFVSTGNLSEFESAQGIEDPSNFGLDSSLPLRAVLYHPFNSQVTFLLSDLESPSEPITKCSEDFFQEVNRLGSYQFFKNFEISQIMEPSFAQDYLRSGFLIALSVSKSPGEDLFAIDGHGTIHLRVCQSTYQTLGLAGRPSKFGPKDQYYIIKINMRLPEMRSGKKGYNRIRKCLESFPKSEFESWLEAETKLPPRVWDVVMTYTDKNGDLKPVQIQSSSSKSAVKTLFPRIEYQNRFFSKTPTSNVNFYSDGDLSDFYDFIGQVILKDPDSLKGICNLSRASLISSIGFFHPKKLVEIVKLQANQSKLMVISCHTAPFSPFSFLTNRQTQEPLSTKGSCKSSNKKRKNGKSKMLGPERGTYAGPTSWTLVLFEPKSFVSSSDLIKFTNEDRSNPMIDSEIISKAKITKEGKDGMFNTESLKRKTLQPDQNYFPDRRRQWILYEAVGSYDTHC